jgi:hypothetical protein
MVAKSALAAALRHGLDTGDTAAAVRGVSGSSTRTWKAGGGGGELLPSGGGRGSVERRQGEGGYVPSGSCLVCGKTTANSPMTRVVPPLPREATWAGLSAPPVTGIWADRLPVGRIAYVSNACFCGFNCSLAAYRLPQLCLVPCQLPPPPVRLSTQALLAPRSTDITRQRA